MQLKEARATRPGDWLRQRETGDRWCVELVHAGGDRTIYHAGGGGNVVRGRIDITTLCQLYDVDETGGQL